MIPATIVTAYILFVIVLVLYISLFLLGFVEFSGADQAGNVRLKVPLPA